MAKVRRWSTGDGKLYLVNGWSGNTGSWDKLQDALKRDGTAAYFVPGHAMAITDTRVNNGVKQVLVNNWWGSKGQKGATGDGWRNFSRV